MGNALNRGQDPVPEGQWELHSDFEARSAALYL